MKGQEQNQSSPPESFIALFKPLWKIVRDGFPLALFSLLFAAPMMSIQVFGAHDSLYVANVIALFTMTNFAILNTINFSCGFAFQVNRYKLYLLTP